MMGLERIVKPIFLAMIYLNCLSFMPDVISPLNPTVAFGLYIWELGAYNSKPNKDQDITVFELNNYGTYVWIYLFAPLMAGLISGLLVKKIKDVYGYSDAPGAAFEGSA